MGGAGAAAGAGADALYLNPATLSRFEPESARELAVGYDALLETAYAGSGAFAAPLGRAGALAVGFVYSSQSPQTSYNAIGDATGRFTPADLALGGWYAHRLGRVALAAGLKLIRSSLAERSGSTGAADLGVLARHVTDLGDAPLDLGASVVNLGPPLKLGQSADPLPLAGRLGSLVRFSPRFDAALDIVLPVDNDPSVSLGAEARFPASLAGSAKPWNASLRGGYDASRNRGVEGFAGLSLGAGLDFARLRLDYAWLPFGDLGSVNRISLAFRF